MSWQFLKKILEEDPDFSTKFVGFEPGIGKVYLFSERTGYEELQVVESEKGLGWHPFLANGKIYLAPENIPAFKVHLYGEQGFNHLNTVAQDLAVIYTSDEFKGVALTKSIFDQMPQRLTEGKRFILKDQYLSKEEHTTVSGVWMVREEGVAHGKALFIEHGQFYYKMGIEAQMMPIIKLPDETLVEMGRKDYNGSTQRKALNIRVACDLEVQREEIMQMVKESEDLNRKIRETLGAMKI